MSDYSFEKLIDRNYMVDLLTRLLKVDCTVSMGPQTLMSPNDPKLVNYVQNVIRPELQKIGVYNIIDVPNNQILAKLGTGKKEKTLLIMCYTPVQHYNLMKDPFSGKIAVPVNDGVMEPCAYGQGASQNKSHFTSMLTLLKALIDSKTEIDGTLYVAANNEGRSSHECTWSLLPHLDPKPDYAIILIGGSNRISVANRGRVDILIDVKGKATHSSDPSSGLNAIDGAVEVLGRIKQMKFTKTHPKLGGQHAVPYQLTFEPIAPHTLPEYAHIKIDRRLLPGDEIDEAVEEIRTAIGNMAPYMVSVKKDVYMLPSEVDPNSEVVKSLQNAIQSIDGKEASLVYGKGAYDAGGPTSKGIPTIMYGRPITGKSLLGDDYVSLRGVEEEARIIGKTLLDIMN